MDIINKQYNVNFFKLIPDLKYLIYKRLLR